MIADTYGVAQSTVGRIKRRESWRSLDWPKNRPTNEEVAHG
jgi:hypothetical protein